MLAGGYRFFLFFVGTLCGSLLLAKQARTEELIDIQIICDSSEVSPNAEIWVGLVVSLSPQWHIYWKNQGESGYPSTLRWKLPLGWVADSLQFPAPYLYEYEGMTGYALEHNFTLLARLVAPPSIEGQVEIEGTFDALICNESTCLPYEHSFSLNLEKEGNSEVLPQHLSLLDQAKNLLPISLPAGVSAWATFEGRSGRINIKSDHFSSFAESEFSFFPEDPAILIDHTNSSYSKESQTLLINWQLSEDVEELPESLDGVLNHPKLAQSWFISVPVNSSKTSLGMNTPGGDEGVPASQFQLLYWLLALVLIAMAACAYGKSCQPHALARNWQTLALVSLGTGLWLGYPNQSGSPLSGSLQWQPWSYELQNELLAEGEAIYIDYTAKWCLSCQVNKRVYSEELVRNVLIEHGVHLLRADWTKKSPDILKSLQNHGREGVPFNVFYPTPKQGEQATPIYLPEILTSDDLVEVVQGGHAIKQLSGESNNFLVLLGLAWIGGLILNLMPCVFPVIGLKILGFVRQAGEDRGLIVRHGWVFTIGVVLSFWVLVGILLLLRDGLEQQLGWGFQLQEPIFVLVLAILLFLFGLSLSGVFEIGMSVSGLGADLSRKSGLWGSFFSGILATVVATPCMAPFLGVAVGAALTMPALSSLMVFTSIALGLSTPYLLLAFFPAWMEKLPKPGAWMESFKQFMAFPIYATVAWLIWTLDGLL